MSDQDPFDIKNSDAEELERKKQARQALAKRLQGAKEQSVPATEPE